MNKRENKNTKTISKSSLKKEEHRIKNIMPENINKDINKDTNKNYKKNNSKNNDTIFVNTNHYSNMLEDIENETFIINNEFIKDCNDGNLTRSNARKKENKELLNTYINKNKIYNKKHRNKDRLEKELNNL